ncbi:MAG: RimK family alpha-L-glutamate ligase [Clostridiales bacterium]|nr:RimK family alpha-L-glutamate ligase [Clostridiales bacterium]
MAGYLIYNGFWNPKGPPDAVRRLQQAGERAGEPLTPLPNTALAADFAGGTPAVRRADTPGKEPLTAADFALFWDKDVRLARTMEAVGMRLYNPADGVAVCDDKAATHLALARHGLPMPRTLAAPMTYLHMDAGPAEAFYRTAEELLGYPLVLKECFGSLGGQVHLVRDGGQLRRLADTLAARPFLLQEYIPPGGEDFRLYMVGGRLTAAMRRVNPADFRANIGSGGHGQAYVPTAEETALAQEACRVLGVPIAGVDILHTPQGKPLLCEVNSSAQLAGITACTGVDIAGEIVSFVRRCEEEKNRTY